MKKVLAMLLVFLMAFSCLAGCGKKEVDITPSTPQPETTATTPEATAPETPAVPTAEGEGTLHVAVNADISTLNGHMYSMSRDSDAADMLAIYLYRSYIGDDYKFKRLPEFAADFPQQMDDTRTVWQIPLRQGLTWENGDPLNADTVMYSYKMLIDPKLLNSRASYFNSNTITILNGEAYTKGECEWEDVGLKKIDDYTVELTTVGAVTADEIVTHLCFNCSMAMVHEATYEAAMNEDRTATMYGTSKDTYMSAGSFILKEWIPGASITYEKNPDWVFADKIWVHEVVERVVTDNATTLQMFLNGEIDYVSLGAEEYTQYQEDPRLIESDASSMYHIAVNMKNPDNPILDNLNFRKALYYGTDRVAVANVGSAIPAWYIQPQMVIGDLSTGESFRELQEKIHPEYTPENWAYDPALAKECFDKALEETGIKNVTVTLLYNSDNSKYKACSEYLQKAWAEIFGADRFTLEIQGMPNSQMTATKKSWKENANAYDIGWGGWSTSKIAPWNG
ncbi:MAG: hypothetical protein HUJ80_03220, partial [Firmicutes bacterium]|nr:hypothetical protein [Bacillota bacterium]